MCILALEIMKKKCSKIALGHNDSSKIRQSLTFSQVCQQIIIIEQTETSGHKNQDS